MPVLKPINGHASTIFLQDYLEGDRGERPLAIDVHNIDPRRAHEWSKVMDETRTAFGNDVAFGAYKRPLTYKHYVLSPDPRDGVSLDDLRDLAQTWVEDNFDDYEVAITYHDDNENHIPHAHVVINNTNLESGKRLSSYLSKKKLDEVWESLQALAHERGFQYFVDDDQADSGRAEEERDAERVFGEQEYEQWRPQDRRRRRWDGERVRSHGETGRQERKGDSWMFELRCWVRVARELSATEDEFLRTLAQFGVTVTDSARGDWLFHHPSAPDSRKARGARLGETFSKSETLSWLALGYSAWWRQQEATGSAGVDLTDEQRECVVSSVVYVGHGSRGCGASLAQIADMLEYNRTHGVTSMSDYARDRSVEARLAASVARRMGLFSRANVRATERARGDADVVLDWLHERAAQGGGGVDSAHAGTGRGGQARSGGNVSRDVGANTRTKRHERGER